MFDITEREDNLLQAIELLLPERNPEVFLRVTVDRDSEAIYIQKLLNGSEFSMTESTSKKIDFPLDVSWLCWENEFQIDVAIDAIRLYYILDGEHQRLLFQEEDSEQWQWEMINCRELLAGFPAVTCYNDASIIASAGGETKYANEVYRLLTKMANLGLGK